MGGALEPLRKVVLERLIRYYRYLLRMAVHKSVDTITSAQLGSALNIDPTQVRKDFGAIGLMGISRVGYEVCEVCRAIRLVFGFDRPYQAVLVGSGHLGQAILNYPGFARYGLQIVAAFDSDPEKIGTEVAGLRVRPIRSLKPYVRKHGVRMAILTTPVSVSADPFRPPRFSGSEGDLELQPYAALRARGRIDQKRVHLCGPGPAGLSPEHVARPSGQRAGRDD